VQRYTRIANAPFLSLRCQFLINRQGNSWPALRDLLYLYQGILRPDLDMTVFRICPFLISYWHRCDNLRRLTRWSGNDPIQYVDRRVEPLRNSWTQLNRITRRGKLTCSDDVQRCRRSGRSVMPSFPCRIDALSKKENLRLLAVSAETTPLSYHLTVDFLHNVGMSPTPNTVADGRAHH
jgi:hypothetical protein